MSIEVRSDEFDRQGNLTSAGKSDFCREVDRAITKFDAGRITLLPHTSQTFNKNKATKKRTLPKEGNSPSAFIKCITTDARKYASSPSKESPAKHYKLMTPPPKKRHSDEAHFHHRDEYCDRSNRHADSSHRSCSRSREYHHHSHATSMKHHSHRRH